MTIQELLMFEGFALLTVVPIALAFRQCGRSLLWSLALFIPYIGIFICLYMLAYGHWPKAPRSNPGYTTGYVAVVGSVASLLFRELLLAVLFPVILPAWILVKRAGFSGWHVIWCFVPILNVVFVWVFGFVRWPAIQEQPNTTVERDAPQAARPSL